VSGGWGGWWRVGEFRALDPREALGGHVVLVGVEARRAVAVDGGEEAAARLADATERRSGRRLAHGIPSAGGGWRVVGGARGGLVTRRATAYGPSAARERPGTVPRWRGGGSTRNGPR